MWSHLLQNLPQRLFQRPVPALPPMPAGEQPPPHQYPNHQGHCTAREVVLPQPLSHSIYLTYELTTITKHSTTPSPPTPRRIQLHWILFFYQGNQVPKNGQASHPREQIIHFYPRLWSGPHPRGRARAFNGDPGLCVHGEWPANCHGARLWYSLQVDHVIVKQVRPSPSIEGLFTSSFLKVNDSLDARVPKEKVNALIGTGVALYRELQKLNSNLNWNMRI